MSLSRAYAGKILRIDLSTGRTTTLDTAQHADRFLGGRGGEAGAAASPPPPANADEPPAAGGSSTGDEDDIPF